MNIQIEKGIPAPAARGNSKYPWKEMQVGDSFFIPCDVPEKCRSIAISATGSGRRFFKGVKTEVQPTGVRVWRTA